MSLVIRPATVGDLADIFRFIHALAEYEKAPNEVLLSTTDLEQSFFGVNPQVYCLLSELDGVVTGIAIWHLNYSTWLGKHGMYFCLLYTSPSPRDRTRSRMPSSA